MNIVIIGGGVAGTTAAEELRKLLPGATLTILDTEGQPLYSRVLLPHFLHGKVPRERVFLKRPEWYAAQNINLVHDTVLSLDTMNRTVTTTLGTSYPYDKLLIAGGGTLKTLPFSNDPHAHHLQTIEDADRIYRALNNRSKYERTEAHIFGGGFISMEFLNLFVPRKFETHVHLRSDQFFFRSFSPTASRLLQSHLEAHGITIHTNNTLDRLPATADIAGIGVGLSSQFSWAKDAGIEVGHGILANEFLETNVTDVYTAGDSAEYQDIVVDRRVHIGNWMNAQMQGRHVAKVMAGAREPFRLVSSYSTDALGLSIIAVGDAMRDAAEEIVERPHDGGHTEYFLRDGKLVGAILLNAASYRAETTKNIGQPFAL